MYSLIACLAAASLGINYGWQRMPEVDGMQYIIQIDPRDFDALRDGRAIESDVPAGAGNVRSYRIVVGREKLPHDTPPIAPPPASLPALTPEAAKPLANQRTAFMDPKPTNDDGPPPRAETVRTDTSQRPWLPLTFALLGLFASLGGNAYLGWIAWDACRFRQRKKWGLAPEP